MPPQAQAANISPDLDIAADRHSAIQILRGQDIGTTAKPIVEIVTVANRDQLLTPLDLVMPRAICGEMATAIINTDGRTDQDQMSQTEGIPTPLGETTVNPAPIDADEWVMTPSVSERGDMSTKLVPIAIRTAIGLAVFAVALVAATWTWIAGRMGQETWMSPGDSFVAMLVAGGLVITAGVALFDALRQGRSE